MIPVNTGVLLRVAEVKNVRMGHATLSLTLAAVLTTGTELAWSPKASILGAGLKQNEAQSAAPLWARELEASRVGHWKPESEPAQERSEA